MSPLTTERETASTISRGSSRWCSSHSQRGWALNSSSYGFAIPGRVISDRSSFGSTWGKTSVAWGSKVIGAKTASLRSSPRVLSHLDSEPCPTGPSCRFRQAHRRCTAPSEWRVPFMICRTTSRPTHSTESQNVARWKGPYCYSALGARRVDPPDTPAGAPASSVRRLGCRHGARIRLAHFMQSRHARESHDPR